MRNGWTPYMIEQPELGALCCWWDEYNSQQWVGTILGMPPHSNNAYLWWKLTGIEKQKWERSI